MQRLFARAQCSAAHSLSYAFLTSRRLCATVPSEDDVLKAYKTLGVPSTASLTDVKKRYGALAKEHHPDVSASANFSTLRMTDINDAYNTVKTFFQAGQRLSTCTTSSSSSPHTAAGGSGYYSKQDGSYQPWYEDMDPLMYELMWEEMRRQNEESPFHGSSDPEEFMRGGPGHWGGPRGPTFNGGNGNRNKQRNSSGSQQKTQQQQSRPPRKTTTWPDEQVKALVNMYQDGKSFEFVANALGKDNATVVMEEFNRWSADNKAFRRGNHSNQWHGNGGKRRRPYQRPNGFYYAESPDELPFDLYEMMEEEPYYGNGGAEMGNPFGYYGDDGSGDDMPHEEPIPFYGAHQMSGGGLPNHRNNGFRQSRNQRNGGQQKQKRNSGNNKNYGGTGNAKQGVKQGNQNISSAARK